MPRGVGTGETSGTHRMRVLFLAWGYSIHAERRIRVFAEDPRFEVEVVSGFPYEIPGVRHVPLSKAWTTRGLLRRTLHAVAHRVTVLLVLHNLLVGLWDLAILRRAARAFRPHVVFLQTLLYPCYLGLLLPRRYPTAITFWNGDLTWYAKASGLERLFKLQIVSWGLRRAAAITVNSAAAESKALELGAPRERVHVIRYPGIDLRRFSPGPRDEARAALGIAARDVVLWPRGLGSYLNSDVLVEASPAIVRAHPGVQFLMLSGVGGDAERERHVRRLEALGTAERFRWVGQIEWAQMPAYYRASDVVVSISSKDSLPNCMTEAMACGVPLVLGDISPLREWITPGANALVVPPRDVDALARAICVALSRDEGVLGPMVRRNLALVEEVFSGERNCTAVKELIATLPERPR